MYKNPVWTVACYLVIAVSLFVLISSGIMRSLDSLNPQSPHADFYLFYAAGQMWNNSQEPYDYDLFREEITRLTYGQQVRSTSGYFYPPQATLLFSLLARLPIQSAYLTFLGINLILLFLSLTFLGYILSWYRPIRLLEVTVLVSFAATGFGRMNIREGQLGLVLGVFVLATFILARNRHTSLAGISLAALTIKPTFFPLFLGFYNLRRSYQMVAVCLLVAVLFTILPLIFTQHPIIETTQAWLSSLQRQYAAGTIDDPSPFTPNSALMSHLEPLVYRVLNAKSTLTTSVYWLIVLSLVTTVAYLLRRKPSHDQQLLDFGIVSALSLLVIYHRPYDSFLLFPGILYIYLVAVSASDKSTRWMLGLLITGVIFALIIPIDLSTRVSARYPALLDSYLWRLVAPFQAWAGVLIFGTLLWLKAKDPLLKKQIILSKQEGQAVLLPD